MIEPLEARTFFSFSLAADGTLTVSGGDGNDYLNVYGIKDSIAVQENGEVTAAYKRSLVKRVVMYGMSGDDRLQNSTGIQCTLYGGDGNDRLESGDAPGLLYGGDGDDTLQGGKYDVRMYGGKGNDNLQGGDGNDLLSPDEGNDQAVNGGGRAGKNTLVLPPPGSTVNNRSNIQVTKPNSYVPPNTAIPVGISTYGPKLSLAKAKNGHTILKVNYTIPDDGAEALFGPEVMNVSNTLTIDVITTSYSGTTKPLNKKMTMTYDLGTPPAGYSVRVRGLTGSGASIKGI